MGDKTYVVKEETLTGIADAVRGMRYEKGEMTPTEIEAKIRASHLGIPITVSNHIDPETGKWKRPAEYPDLDSIDIPDDFDGVYLTYDLRKTPGYGWIGVNCELHETGGTYTIERGHLENGVFIVDETHTENDNVTFRQALDDAYGDVQLWRVRSSNKKIARFGFMADGVSNNTNQGNMLQPCVERVGRLDYVISIAGNNINTNPSYKSYGTVWLERDAVKITGKQKCTSCQNAWRYCYSLQSLDVGEWNTSAWKITSLSYAWASCYSLQSLDLSTWNTDGWEIANTSGCWDSCYSLQFLDIGEWDVSKWHPTNLNWWSNCCSLRTLDLSEWDVSGWAVTSLASCWNGCYSLQSLDIGEWDVSGWAVTSLASCWNGCYSLQSLDIGEWDVSGWAVTSLANCWNSCYSLQSLDLSGWDTSGWVVTNLDSVFYVCRSLKTLDISHWDVSNWNPTTMYGFIRGCNSLQELDLSSWDVSGWIAWQDFRYALVECFSLKRLILPSALSADKPNINVSPSHSTTLIEYNGYGIYQTHSYSNCIGLSHASLISILNKLGTVTAARTITLGQTNRLKLTEAEIAIATQKGWTVA